MTVYGLVKTFSLGDVLSIGVYRDLKTAREEMINQVEKRREELGEEVHEFSVESRTAKVYYDGGCLAEYWKIVPCKL